LDGPWVSRFFNQPPFFASVYDQGLLFFCTPSLHCTRRIFPCFLGGACFPFLSPIVSRSNLVPPPCCSCFFTPFWSFFSFPLSADPTFEIVRFFALRHHCLMGFPCRCPLPRNPGPSPSIPFSLPSDPHVRVLIF